MADQTDRSSEQAHDAGGAARRPDVGNSARGGESTGAGREATNDAPRDHPGEHQSNYGGGGANGGAEDAKADRTNE